METWVGLFRGINVGGKNIVPMAKLRTLIESQNGREVRTYIQSGNVVWKSRIKTKETLTKQLLDGVESAFAFRPKLLLLSASEFLAAKANNPFAEAINEPKSLHFFFLDEKPEAPDMDSIANLATSNENYALVDRVFYFHAPDGFGRSKLAKTAERKLGVTATVRNFATVEKIAAMLQA